jgi:hypothetical protein
MVAYARTRGRPCLTDIVFDTVNCMARLPEMTFIVIKNWEMVSASLISDSQSWIDGMYRERHRIAVPHIVVTGVAIQRPCRVDPK